MLFLASTRGDTVGSGTALQAGRSRVQFPIVSLKFFIDKSFRPHYGPGLDSGSNRNKYQQYFLWGKCGRCVGLTTLPHSCVDFLEILGASTSWNTQGLSRDCITLIFTRRKQIHYMNKLLIIITVFWYIKSKFTFRSKLLYQLGLNNVLFCFLDSAFSIMKTKINQQNAQINSGLIYYWSITLFFGPWIFSNEDKNKPKKCTN